MIFHTSPISGVDAYSDRFVATAGYDNQVILWDSITKRSLARGAHDHLANQCRFSTDGRYLVSASSDYTARIWAVPSLRLVAVMVDHEDDVEMAAMCPRSMRVATASRDHKIRIFDTAGRRQLVLAGHASDVLTVEWARQGTEIVSSSDDGTVRRWSSASGDQLEVIDCSGAETDTLVCTGDGLICLGNDRGEIIVVGERPLSPVRAHSAGVKRLAFEPTKGLLLSAGYDRMVKFWSVVPGGGMTCILQTEAPACVWPRSCSFAEGSRVVFGTFGQAYASFDLTTRAWDLDLVGTTSGLNSACLAGSVLYTVGDAGVVRSDYTALGSVGSLCNFIGCWRRRVITGGQIGILFDALTHKPLYQYKSPLNCMATFFREGEEYLIVGTYTGEGLVFKASPDGCPELERVVPLHDNAVKGLACNSKTIFSVCATGAAAIHSIDTLGLLHSLPTAHSKISNGVAALPDGRFATVSRDRRLRLWTGPASEEIITPHDHSIKCIAADPRIALLATGAYDGTVALYDWSNHNWTYRSRPTASGVSSLIPAIKAGSFFATSYDGHVYTIPD